MRIRLLTFTVWALTAAAGLFWGLQLFVSGQPVPDGARVPGPRVSALGDLQRLLGAAAPPSEAAPAPASSRFQLLGVVAPREGSRASEGVALIAVDRQPARAWRTGAVVDGELVLLSVSRRSVQLGPRGGPATTELTLPDPNGSARAAAPALTVPSAQAGVNPPLPVPGRRVMGMPQGEAPAEPGVPAVAPGNADDNS